MEDGAVGANMGTNYTQGSVALLLLKEAMTVRCCVTVILQFHESRVVIVVHVT